MAGRRSGGGSILIWFGVVVLAIGAGVWAYAWYSGRAIGSRPVAWSGGGVGSTVARPGRVIPKPSAGAVAVAPGPPARPSVAVQLGASGAVGSPVAAPAAGGAYTDLSIMAKHKEGWGGGCTGRLDLSKSGVSFVCPGQPGMRFALAEIEGPHKDGFALAGGGRKYHFEFFDESGRKVEKGKVEGLFERWWENVRSVR